MSDEPRDEDQEVADADDFALDAEDFRQLLRSGDEEGLNQALANPVLVRMAADDERYFEIALQGIAALAWRDPTGAGHLLKRYDPNKVREKTFSNASLTAQCIVAAMAWTQLESTGLLPSIERFELLKEFLRLRPALKDDPDFGAELRADLRERPEAYAEFLSALPLHSAFLAEWIFHLGADLPELDDDDKAADEEEEDDGPLAGLEEEQLGALSTAMDDLKGQLGARWTRYATWLAVVGAVLAFPGAAGLLLGLLILGISMAMDEKRSYLSIVRPRLVTLAIEHGVGAQQVVSWLYRLSGKAGKVSSFDIKIGNDAGLDLLAAISRVLPTSEG